MIGFTQFYRHSLVRRLDYKVCHISTAHPAFDVRIFHKQCKTLRDAGYEVHIIIQHSQDEIIDGIYFHALPTPKNRKERVLKLTRLALKKALEINANVYHFHDPELIPIALKLKKLGYRVIYDVHEDVPRQLLNKSYLNKVIKKVLSLGFEIYENHASKRFDAIITATPHIRDRFSKLNPRTVDVNNFPFLDELFKPISWNNRKNEICYIGGISCIRGIVELIKALEYVDTILHLAGEFESESLKKKVMSMPGWKKVRYYGFVNREKVKEILSKVKIGIVTFLPFPNHVTAQPNKMFEYMSAGIPVIASNFPLWRKIIEGNNCGLCVDPTNPASVAKAINYLLENNNLARQMGENGRISIIRKYNWERESRKLLELYKEVLKR